jgi:hypothetical protein
MPPLATVLVDGDWLTAVFRDRRTGVPFDALAAALETTCGPLHGSWIYISNFRLDSREVERLSDLGLEIRTNTTRGSSLDVQMAVDALGFAGAGDRIVLVSGDADFVPVVERLVEVGTDVTLVFSRTSTSIKLFDIPSVRYVGLTELLGELTGPPPRTRPSQSPPPVEKSTRRRPARRRPDAQLDNRHAFVSYVREDSSRVDRLAEALRGAGLQVWRDKDQLLPGQRWQDEIRKAIRGGSFFLACFSEHSETKARSYMREELTIAIEELRLKPRDVAWFIPVKLGPCEIPSLAIGPGEDLSTIHYADLSQDWTTGVDRLIASLSLRPGGAQ